jgi:hypothetical protein
MYMYDMADIARLCNDIQYLWPQCHGRVVGVDTTCTSAGAHTHHLLVHGADWKHTCTHISPPIILYWCRLEDMPLCVSTLQITSAYSLLGAWVGVHMCKYMM